MTRREGALRPLANVVSPAYGAVVMGTGIISIAFYNERHIPAISRSLMLLTALAWLLLVVVFIDRFMSDRARFHQERHVPAALTGVAGTAVLGTRLTLQGWTFVGLVFLVLALASWLAFLFPVLRHWHRPTAGVSLLLTVSTESLAVLAATLAVPLRQHWLAVAALVPCVLGLAFYVFVMVSFDYREILFGHGDHWVTGGALAISTLAASKISLAWEDMHMSAQFLGPLKACSIALWVLTMLWLPVLVVAEVAKPRLEFDVRRFSTVFPLGMYAACSFFVESAALKSSAILDFVHVWVWVGLAAWAVASAAMLRNFLQLRRGEGMKI
jgi:hypothetical protein